jgi:ABC-type nitrate/sulfonate/bicarbonate transport system substrate-binding protein
VVCVCGGGAAGQGSGPQNAFPFTAAYPATGAAISQAVLAQTLGFFKQEGLDVKLELIAGGTIVNSVVSGEADVAATGASAVDLLAQKGENVVMVWGASGNGSNDVMVGGPAVQGFADLKSKQDCVIASTAQGTSPYGVAYYYIRLLGLPCKVVPYSSTQLELAALLGGRADAGVNAYDNVAPVVAQGKLHWLIDPTKPTDYATYIKGKIEVTETVWFGIAETLKKKREATLRLMRAFGKVDKVIHTMSGEQLAKAAQQIPEWQTLDFPQLVISYAAAVHVPFMNPDHGYITTTRYNAFLNFAATDWGLQNFSASDPAFAYSKRVDMSYYVTALGKPSL